MKRETVSKPEFNPDESERQNEVDAIEQSACNLLDTINAARRSYVARENEIHVIEIFSAATIRVLEAQALATLAIEFIH